MAPPDLRALAERFDPRSRDTYLTLYADFSDPHHRRALEGRAKEVRAALGDAQAKGFDASLAKALGALDRVAKDKQARGAAVFASDEHGFVEAHPLAAPIPTRLVLDSGPYIKPLARFADEYEDFVLVLLDGERAAVYEVELARAELAAKERTRLMGRHTKGGWSQMRYQRHRRGALNRFYDDVVEHVEAILREGDAERIIVAGPGQAKREFLGRLPKGLQDAVIAVEDAEFDGEPDDDLVRRYVKLARAEEAEASAEAVGALRAELRRGDLAVAGPFPVARAAREGRVELLVVRKDHKAGGRKCEAHEAFFEPAGKCPVGGEEGTEVDLLNEAVEYTVRNEGRIEFVERDDAFVKGIDGVGAVLRW